MMRLTAVFATFAIASVQQLTAATTYATLSGEVNLVAGLTNLTSTTAIGTTNQAVGIDYITDSDLNTGIANLGALSGITPNGGTLAGTFGGGTYFASSNKIMLIGRGYEGNTYWGGWTLRLLLSDGNYSPPLSYTDANLAASPGPQIPAGSASFQNTDGSTFYPPVLLPSYYQMVDISLFDTGNIGVKGIELSGMTSQFPDISYIGVTGETSPIPEPSGFFATSLLLGGAGLIRRRQTRAA